MQRLTVKGRELEVRRGFSLGPNQPLILELMNGTFTYNSGVPVDKRELFDALPEPHRAKAYAWFDMKDNPEAVKEAALDHEAGELSAKEMRANLKMWGVKVPFGMSNADMPAFYKKVLAEGYTKQEEPETE